MISKKPDNSAESQNTIHYRTVKSYVRREGRITRKQEQALAEYWSIYGLEVAAGMLDFKKIFGRQTSCILEIGFGMGHALFTMAKQNPEHDFIGVEVHRPGVGNLLHELAAEKLSNVRVFSADVVEVLRCCIPDESLTAVHIFFPDPWPKKRHHKRRLIQTEFVNLIQQKLIPKGYLHLATDWEDYAQHILAVLADMPGFVNTAGEAQFVARPKERPLTKFELRGERLGHVVRDLVFVKE